MSCTGRSNRGRVAGVRAGRTAMPGVLAYMPRGEQA
jgi:hypothetical protein